VVVDLNINNNSQEIVGISFNNIKQFKISTIMVIMELITLGE